MAIKEQYPYVDENGKEYNNLCKHYSDSGNSIIKLETSEVYSEAVDKYPCKYTYDELLDEVSEQSVDCVES